MAKPDEKPDTRGAKLIGAKHYEIGGFSFDTPDKPESILYTVAETYRAILVQTGHLEEARKAGPFLKEPAAQAVLMWLCDEIEERKNLEQRVKAIQETLTQLLEAKAAEEERKTKDGE